MLRGSRGRESWRSVMPEPSPERLHFLDYWRVMRSRKEIVLAVFLLVVLTGGLITYAMPKVYRSSVLVQVKEETPESEIWKPPYYRYDPLFLRTQFEIIQSARVLEEVIRKLNLTERLGRAYGYASQGERAADLTLKLLSRNLRVHQYRDTNLIELQVYLSELGGTPEEAPRLVAEIADEIAETYRNQELDRVRQRTERVLKGMLEALEDQRVKVADLEKRVDEIRERHQINLVGSWDYGEENTLQKISLSRLDANRIQARLEMEEKKAKLDKILSLSTNELLDVAHLLIGDPALSALVAERRKAEVELARLRQAELGPRHPDVVKVRAVIDELDLKIREAVTALKAGVLHDYQAAQAKLDALTSEVEELKARERSAEATGLREFARAKEDLEHARKIRDALETRYLQQRIEMRIPRANVEVIQHAKVPPLDDPVRPNVPLNLLLSVLLGLGAGIGLAYFVEYLDTSVKTIEDVERYLGVSVLGVIPQKVRPLVERLSEPAHAEAYRVLRTNILFSKRLEKGKSICITSGSVGEGKTLTLFNLAYVCAQLGDRVLIVDSDLHRPRQHKILGVSNQIGLATVLVGRTPLEEAIVVTRYPNLHVLPSGRVPSSSHGLLATQKMSDLVAELKRRYDWAFFDSPPIIGVSDASLLVREVDGVLLVVQHRKYPRAVSARAREMIANIGGNLLGVVLNNINIARDHTYYYYQQHYYYYPRRERAEGAEGAGSGPGASSTPSSQPEAART